MSQPILPSTPKPDDPLAGTRNADAVRAFLRLLEGEDIDAFLDLWAQEARQDMPYAPPGFPRSFDTMERVERQYRGLPETYEFMRYPDLEVFETQDPRVVAASFRGEIKLKDSDQRYDNAYVNLFVIDEAGKIVRVVEHFNPLVLTEAGAFGDGGLPKGAAAAPRNGDGPAPDCAGEASRASWARSFFATVDSRDADRIAEHFSPDVHLAFGNRPALHGREAARESFAQVAGAVRGVRHEIKGVWTGQDGGREVVSVEADVIYTRLDGRTVTVPATSTLRLDGDLVRDYRIFIDTTPVFGPDAVSAQAEAVS